MYIMSKWASFITDFDHLKTTHSKNYSKVGSSPTIGDIENTLLLLGDAEDIYHSTKGSFNTCLSNN
jgi:hypothetical protein